MKKEKLLITGINGFLADYLLIELAKKDDFAIFGIDTADKFRYRSQYSLQKYYNCNIIDKDSIYTIIDDVKPDKVINLAGILKGSGFSKFFSVNLIGTLVLLEALIAADKDSDNGVRVILIGSAAEYGSSYGLSLKEEDELLPLSHYGKSKSLQSVMAMTAYFRKKLEIIVIRPSNIIGPGQGGDLIIPAILDQARHITEGSGKKELVLGNIESKRDFVDVRDVVRGVVLLLTKGRPGEIYNISTDVSQSIREVIGIIEKLIGMEFKVTSNPDRIQKNDIPYISLSYDKIKKEAGWSPSFSLEQTLSDMAKSAKNTIQRYNE